MDSNSYSPDHPVDPATGSLIAARDQLLGPSYRLFYDRPIHLVRGVGTKLYDINDACFLDAYNNVASVGHCHPHVVQAVSRHQAPADLPAALQRAAAAVRSGQQALLNVVCK